MTTKTNTLPVCVSMASKNLLLRCCLCERHQRNSPRRDSSSSRSRLKRRIVEVEEEGRRRSVQSDALERARNWGTFSHLYHYYYYQLPSKQARQRTDGRTVAAAAWGGLESREAVFATTAVSFNDTKILAQKLHEMLRRLELALWSNDYYFYEAASSKRHCIPPVEFQQSW